MEKHAATWQRWCIFSVKWKEIQINLRNYQKPKTWLSFTCSWLTRERDEGGWENPLKCANAAARAFVPSSSVNLWAVGRKWCIDSGWTPCRVATTCSADDSNTSCISGGLINSNLHPTSRSSDLTVLLWLLVNIKMVVPSFPARPVRPERWTKVSGSFGSS